MTPAEAPKGDCPMCGYVNGFVLSEPRYVKEDGYYNSRADWMDGDEYLAWPCGRCGFGAKTPTLQQQVSA